MKLIATLSSLFFSVLFAVIFFVAIPHHVSAQNLTGVVNHVTTVKKYVALTFDADMTPKMLYMLKSKKVSSWYNGQVINTLIREQVPATLFLTGMWVETYPTVTTKLSQNPLFEIGNHSYSHPAFSAPCFKLGTVGELSDTEEMTRTENSLAKYTSHHTHYFRFPGLCADSEDIALARRIGYTVIGGDVHGNDGFSHDTQNIVTHVLSQVTPGSIVVLHMMGGPNAPYTADALPAIIKTLRDKGYTFVTVSDLLRYK